MIFLAHASEDKPQVRALHSKLQAGGFKPWLDEVDLLAGQNWQIEIPKAIRQSDIFVACLSQVSVSKQGYVQREYRLALNIYAEKPPGSIYLIPLKLDKCEMPDLQLPDLGVNLPHIQSLDYWQPDGFDRLVEAIDVAGRTKLHNTQNTAQASGNEPHANLSVVPPNELFQVKPVQAIGENIYFLEPRQEGDLTEKFYVRVHFNFWTKHPVKIVHVDLGYGKSSLSGRQAVVFDRMREATDGAGRLQRQREMDAGAVLDVEIHREFESQFSHSRDYDVVMVEFEVASSEWFGIRHLQATGKLTPGGKLGRVKLMWHKRAA